MISVGRVVDALRGPGFRHVDRLVVVVGGEIVAARELGGRRLDEPADVYSVTKSVLGTVALIAVREGRLSLDASLGELLGARVPQARGRALVRHLLAMTSGADFGGMDAIDEVMTLPDGWVDALLAVPQRHRPGARFGYHDGAAHLLAAALQVAVGDIAELAQTWVFDPLGIRIWDWPRDPEGIPWGFSGLRLSALDLATLGEAWRRDRWSLGSLWRSATTTHNDGGEPEYLPYGWLFWIAEVSGQHAFLAAGWAGQYVLVVPAAELTVVLTGTPERWSPESSRALDLIQAVADAHGT